MKQAILKIKQMDIWISDVEGERAMVRDVTLTISPGKPLTLIGETGCGKTLVAQALLGLLPKEMTARGQITYKGIDLLNMPRDQRNRLWGREIFLFPQEP